MKTLLRLLKRGILLLVSQANYPTPRQRLLNLYTIGKCEGRREALKELPIVQVQPAVPKQIVIQPLHLPPGMWSKLYFEEHPDRRPQHEHAYWPAPLEGVIKSGKNGHVDTSGLASEAPLARLINDDPWLNSSGKHMTPAEIAITKVDTKHDLMEGEPTEHMEAVQKLYYITRTGQLNEQHVE